MPDATAELDLLFPGPGLAEGPLERLLGGVEIAEEELALSPIPEEPEGEISLARRAFLKELAAGREEAPRRGIRAHGPGLLAGHEVQPRELEPRRAVVEEVLAQVHVAHDLEHPRSPLEQEPANLEVESLPLFDRDG